MFRFKLSISYFLILFCFLNCNKTQPIDIEPVTKALNIFPPCENTTQQIERINLYYSEENNIAIVKQMGLIYEINYIDNSSINLCAELIDSVFQDAENWQTTFVFKDSTTAVYSSVGDFESVTTLNPSGNCPLCAELQVSIPRAFAIKVNVLGKNGTTSDVSKNWLERDTLHQVPILGLYADFENEIEIHLLNENSNSIKINTIYIQTEAIDVQLPKVNIKVADAAQMQEGLTFVSHIGSENPNLPFMFDAFGDIRWYIDWQATPILSGLFYGCGMERLQNGNLYFGDFTTDSYYEIDMLGNVVNSWQLPFGFTYHHNIQEKPDGNFLITVNKNSSLHLNGNLTVEDFIIEVDRNSGALIHEWDIKDFLDEWRTEMINGGILQNSTIDWVHCNAVIYDESDNSIIVSGRTQGVFKIGYDDKLKWILAPHNAWGQNRLGENLNDFLLTAIGENNLPFQNQVQLGFLNNSNFEWNWYQHAIMIKENSGNLMLFDNGTFRNFDKTQNSLYSRAVEYEIDEQNMTVKQVWQYGKERGTECKADVVSDVDYNFETDNVIFAAGMGIEEYGIQEVGARIVEVDYSTKNVVFEAVLESEAWITFHRVERMNIYP